VSAEQTPSPGGGRPGRPAGRRPARPATGKPRPAEPEAGGTARAGARTPRRRGDGPGKTRKPMPPGREAAPRKNRAAMPPGREAAPTRARPAVAFADPSAGRRIALASYAGTGLLLATTLLAVAAPGSLDAPALVVALAMFFGGIGAFAAAYVVAVGRSRELDIGLAGLYGLSGSAPTPVRVRLFGSLGVEVVVAVAGAAIRPATSLAFGILAPMWGLGVAGLWGARHGAFPARSPRRNDRPRRG